MAEEGLGSLDGGLQDPEMEETKPPSAPTLALVKQQPCNQATMVCLRGPCVHLWRLVLRFDSAVKDVMTERSWTCLASPREEFDLNDRMVYFCDRWWPAAPYQEEAGEDEDGFVEEACALAFDEGLIYETPVHRRCAARPALHASWEACLREDGYDFSWRDFDPEHNRDDDPDRRGFNAPGELEEHIEAEQVHAGLPPPGSIPEDDPPPVKTPEEEAAEAEAELIHRMLKKQEEDDA